MGKGELNQINETLNWLSMQTQLKQALEEANWFLDYLPNRQAQYRIIDKLPQSLPGNLRSSVECGYWQSVQKNRISWKANRFDAEKELSGKLFETLVLSQFPEFNNSLARELVDFMIWSQDEQRLDRLGIGKLRIPDFLVMEKASRKQEPVVVAMAEAKLGHFRQRLLSQLRIDGFQMSMERALRNLPLALEKTEKFTYLKKWAGRIQLAPEVKQIVILPAEKAVASPDSYILTGMFSDNELAELTEILNDRQRVELRNSVFSSSEVKAMAKVLSVRLNLSF